jgi:hypothetical protein
LSKPDMHVQMQVRAELAESSGKYDELKAKHDETLAKLKAEKVCCERGRAGVRACVRACVSACARMHV